jgi:outer membrane lipoprotein-sorting protein
MALLDVGFPKTRAEFDAQFQIQSLTATDGKWQLALQPRQAGARQFMPELRVFLSTNDFLLAGTELEFVDGSRMRNDFVNTTVNEPVDARQFQWKTPPDYKLVEPFAK